MLLSNPVFWAGARTRLIAFRQDYGLTWKAPFEIYAWLILSSSQKVIRTSGESTQVRSGESLPNMGLGIYSVQ